MSVNTDSFVSLLGSTGDVDEDYVLHESDLIPPHTGSDTPRRAASATVHGALYEHLHDTAAIVSDGSADDAGSAHIFSGELASITGILTEGTFVSSEDALNVAHPVVSADNAISEASATISPEEVSASAPGDPLPQPTFAGGDESGSHAKQPLHASQETPASSSGEGASLAALYQPAHGTAESPSRRPQPELTGHAQEQQPEKETLIEDISQQHNRASKDAPVIQLVSDVKNALPPLESSGSPWEDQDQLHEDQASLDRSLHIDHMNQQVPEAVSLKNGKTAASDDPLQQQSESNLQTQVPALEKQGSIDTSEQPNRQAEEAPMVQLVGNVAIVELPVESSGFEGLAQAEQQDDQASAGMPQELSRKFQEQPVGTGLPSAGQDFAQACNMAADSMREHADPTAQNDEGIKYATAEAVARGSGRREEAQHDVFRTETPHSESHDHGEHASQPSGNNGAGGFAPPAAPHTRAQAKQSSVMEAETEPAQALHAGEEQHVQTDTSSSQEDLRAEELIESLRSREIFVRMASASSLGQLCSERSCLLSQHTSKHVLTASIQLLQDGTLYAAQLAEVVASTLGTHADTSHMQSACALLRSSSQTTRESAADLMLACCAAQRDTSALYVAGQIADILEALCDELRDDVDALPPDASAPAVTPQQRERERHGRQRHIEERGENPTDWKRALTPSAYEHGGGAVAEREGPAGCEGVEDAVVLTCVQTLSKLFVMSPLIGADSECARYLHALVRCVHDVRTGEDAKVASLRAVGELAAACTRAHGSGGPAGQMPLLGGSDIAWQTVCTCMQHTSALMRAAAARVLPELHVDVSVPGRGGRDAPAMPLLAALLNDDDEAVRGAAAQALLDCNMLSVEAAMHTVAECLAACEATHERARMIRCLVHMFRRAEERGAAWRAYSLPLLLHALEDWCAEVRHAAQCVLIEMNVCAESDVHNESSADVLKELLARSSEQGFLTRDACEAYMQVGALTYEMTSFRGLERRGLAHPDRAVREGTVRVASARVQGTGTCEQLQGHMVKQFMRDNDCERHAGAWRMGGRIMPWMEERHKEYEGQGARGMEELIMELGTGGCDEGDMHMCVFVCRMSSFYLKAALRRHAEGQQPIFMPLQI